LTRIELFFLTDIVKLTSQKCTHCCTFATDNDKDVFQKN
jgi:hypothetical protein